MTVSDLYESIKGWDVITVIIIWGVLDLIIAFLWGAGRGIYQIFKEEWDAHRR
jgi:hypothetical protein